MKINSQYFRYKSLENKNKFYKTKVSALSTIFTSRICHQEAVHIRSSDSVFHSKLLMHLSRISGYLLVHQGMHGQGSTTLIWTFIALNLQ